MEIEYLTTHLEQIHVLAESSKSIASDDPYTPFLSSAWIFISASPSTHIGVLQRKILELGHHARLDLVNVVALDAAPNHLPPIFFKDAWGGCDILHTFEKPKEGKRVAK